MSKREVVTCDVCKHESQMLPFEIELTDRSGDGYKRIVRHACSAVCLSSLLHTGNRPWAELNLAKSPAATHRVGVYR